MEADGEQDHLHALRGPRRESHRIARTHARIRTHACDRGSRPPDCRGLLTGTLSEEEVLASLLSTVPLSQAVNGVHVGVGRTRSHPPERERAMRAQCIPVPGAAVENARASIAEQIASIELPGSGTT